MYVRFWGTRGSVPAAATAQQIREKVSRALRLFRSKHPGAQEDIEAFIDKDLPFADRGSYGVNTSCVEIGGMEECILCDAGTGIRDFGHAFMHSAKGRTPAVFHIFLSHLHWDHIQGFPFFPPAYLPGEQIHIYGGHRDIRQALTLQQSPPFFPIAFQGMGATIDFTTLEPGRPVSVAGLDVQMFPQNHPGGSFGYSFVREGTKIVYSTDMEHTSEADQEKYPYVDRFRDADLLIFDAQYSLADASGPKEAWGHSSNLSGVELAVRAGVRRLCLFHSEPTWGDEALDRFLAETRDYLQNYSPASSLRIDLAYDGLEIML